MSTPPYRPPGGRTHFAELLAKRFKGGQEIGRILDDELSRLRQASLGQPTRHGFAHLLGGADALDYSGVPGSISGGPNAQGTGTGISLNGHTHEIPDGTIDIDKLANIAAGVILGNNGGAPGPVEELTATEVTAMLDLFTAVLQGLVPASGGGTDNFLRADGTWAIPPGGGGGGVTAAYVQAQSRRWAWMFGGGGI